MLENKMKSQNFFLFFSSILFLILFASLISAFNVTYPVYLATVEDNFSLTITSVPVNNLTVIGYRCLNPECSAINTTDPIVGLSKHVTNNLVPVVFPTACYSNGYVLYFYKPDYIGWIQKDNACSTGFSPGVNIYLSKKKNAGANISNFFVDSDAGLISATIDSAIKTTDFTLTPLLEKVNTTVNFKINNTITGQVLDTQSKNFIISYSINKEVNFTYNFSRLPSGNYTVTIFTDVSFENKILNPLVYSRSIELIINTSSNDSSAFAITNITSVPVMPFVNNGSSQNISVNFTSNRYPINLTFYLYNRSALINTSGPWKIINNSQLPINYSVPVSLPNGLYFLNMTINDSLGNSGTYVVGNFTINKTIINNSIISDDEDEDSDDRDYYHYSTDLFYENLINNSSISNVNSSQIIFTSKNSQDLFWKLFLYWSLILILVLLILIVLILIIRISRK